MYVDENFLRIDGTNNMIASLDLNNNKVINSIAPIEDKDLTNKAYLEHLN